MIVSVVRRIVPRQPRSSLLSEPQIPPSRQDQAPVKKPQDDEFHRVKNGGVSTARWNRIFIGGILAFVLIPVEAFIGLLLVRDYVNDPWRKGTIELLTTSELAAHAALGLAQCAIFVSALWATTTLFNSRKYRSVDVPILGMMFVAALRFGLVLATGEKTRGLAGGQFYPLDLSVDAFSLTVLCLWAALWIWFGIKAIRYAAFGGGLWKVAGILYVVCAGPFILDVLAQIAYSLWIGSPHQQYETWLLMTYFVAALNAGARLVDISSTIVFSTLIIPAALICHGVALLRAARTM